MDFKTQTIEVMLLQRVFGLNVRRLLLIIIFRVRKLLNTQAQIIKLSFREDWKTFRFSKIVVEMRVNQDSVAFNVI